VPRNTEITRGHEVEFYPDDVAFVVGFVGFIEAALKDEKAVIVVATESHCNSVLQRLQEHGVDTNVDWAAATCSLTFRKVSRASPTSASSFCINGLCARSGLCCC
jgi:hypothetical protein